jgi:hypothetical protein
MEVLTESMPSKTAAKTITLVAYNPKTQLPLRARPQEDHTGMVWTGQGESGYFELLTEEDKRKLKYVVTPHTSVLLEDGKVLNIETNPADKINWVWLQKHPYIAHDKEKGDQRTARFYIADAVKDAVARVDSMVDIDEARYQVRKLSQSNLLHVCKTLGLSAAETFLPEQLLDYALSKASSKATVKAVLEAINPANKARSNAQIFFNEIVKWSVIERAKDGVFYFGGTDGVTLGHSPDMVVEYLLAKENAERVKAMKTMLAEKTKTAVE